MKKKFLISVLALALPVAGLAFISCGHTPAENVLQGKTSGHKKTALIKEDIYRLAGNNKWKRYQGNPILRPDSNWDAGALGSMSVVKAGETYHMFYEAWGTKHTGWRKTDYETLQIGHAVSADGVHWVKDPDNPVLPRGKNQNDWDKGGTWDPFVIYQDGFFKMWYGGGVHPECNWGFATSKDGSRFEKKGRISNLNHVEDNHVVHHKDRYYMYYWDRLYEPMGLFRAESQNETDFDFRNAVKIKIKGEEYPGQYKFTHVLIEDGIWYMFYANFVRPHCPNSRTRLATSHDGLNFKRATGDLIFGHDAEVLKVDEELYLMYYGPQGYFDAKNCDIRLAIYSGGLDELTE